MHTITFVLAFIASLNVSQAKGMRCENIRQLILKNYPDNPPAIVVSGSQFEVTHSSTAEDVRKYTVDLDADCKVKSVAVAAYNVVEQEKADAVMDAKSCKEDPENFSKSIRELTQKVCTMFKGYFVEAKKNALGEHSSSDESSSVTRSNTKVLDNSTKERIQKRTGSSAIPAN